VRHLRFGEGKILNVHANAASIRFAKTEEKRLRKDFVHLARMLEAV